MTMPRGWITARLEDVVAERVSQAEPTARPVPYIDIGAIDRERKSISEAQSVTASTAPTRARQWVKTGDVLVSMTRPNLNAVALVPEALQGAVASTGFDVLRSVGVLPEWIFYRVRSHAFVHDVCKGVQGVVYPAIRPADVRRHKLPIPPAAEQARIVEALDSSLSRLDAAVASLQRAQGKLKAYRASVLKAAVEGRLVPTEAELARKEGRSYESATVLLEHILKERRRCWEEAELARMNAAGKTPKDGRWKANYQEPESLDALPLPRLPDGWCWVPASAMYWDAGYGTSAKCTEDGNGPAVLRIPNIVEGRVGLDDLKFAADDAALRADDRVRQGDFLFIRTNGSRSLIGRGALVLHETDNPLFFASYLIRLRLLTVDSCDRWFALAWSGPQVREQVLRVAASSAGQYNISLSSASSFAIPLPPAAEQARILDEFERLDSGATVVDRDISAGVGRSDGLRQAVLKWAFQGMLVDQDPSDEPAEVLLARIRAERKAVAPCKSKPRRQRKLRVA